MENQSTVTVWCSPLLRFSGTQALLVATRANGTSAFNDTITLTVNPERRGEATFTVALDRSESLIAQLTATVELIDAPVTPMRMTDTGIFEILGRTGPPRPPIEELIRQRLAGLRIDLTVPDIRVLARLPLPVLAPRLVFNDAESGMLRVVQDALLPIEDLLPDAPRVGLSVTWSLVDHEGREAASVAVGIGTAGAGHNAIRVQLTPQPASTWDPLSAEVPPQEHMGRVRAAVTASVEGVVAPQTRAVSSDVEVPLGLPVPTVLALFRCPNMRQAFVRDEVHQRMTSHGPEPDSPLFHPSDNRGEDGAMAIVVPAANPDLATPFNKENTRGAALGTALSAVGMAALGLAPLPRVSLPNGEDRPGGVDGLGDVGIALRLLSESVRVPLPGGGHMPAGLGRIPEIQSRLGEYASRLLGLLDSARLLASVTAELIGRSVSRDAPRIDAYIRQLPGPDVRQAERVSGANIPFIRHRDVFVGTDVNIEDEIESGVLIGGPGARAQLFVLPNMNHDAGFATLETRAGYCCMVSDFNDVGPARNAPNGQPGWFPRNRGLRGTPAADYGVVTVNRTLRSDRTTAPPRVDPSLARVVSSWQIVTPRR